MRIAKFLARAGVASRRKAERLVLEGRVEVNGSVITDLATRIDPERDEVKVDGKRVVLPERVYVLFYKPRGYITALSDPFGRPTIAKFLKDLPKGTFPVGRLDRDSEGLLLLTNDGELAQRLLHPRYQVRRTYKVWLERPPRQELLKRIKEEGIEVEGRRIFPDEIKRLDAKTYLVTVHEGRKREVRKIFAAAGSRVVRLLRVRFGPLWLKGLKPGQKRHLSSEELRRLFKELELS